MPTFVFLLALLLTAVLLASVTRSISARDKAAFEAEATRTADAIRERIDTTTTLLQGAAGLFAARGEVSREQFRDYVAQLGLRERYPGIQGIGYTARVGPGAAGEAVVRDGDDPPLRVWPAGPREEYHAIVFLEPLDERNQAAIGYDMFTEPTRRAAMAHARDTGAAAASGKVILVQEIDASKQAGFLIYLPVYRGGAAPRSQEERRRELQGFVYAPLRVGDLLHGVRGNGVREVDLELYDGTAQEPEALMWSTAETSSQPPAHASTRQLDVAGRPWLLVMSSRPAFEALSHWRLVPWLVVVSLAASVLLAWITLVQARARQDAEQAALERRANELALHASEERARERAQQLEELYGRQRESEQRKDEFLAVLAHELRNPLAPIRNALEILQRAPDPGLAQRSRDIAQRQLRHLVRLVDDLLDVSRISRGKIALQWQRVSAGDVLESAVETSRPLFERRRHELVVSPIDGAVEIECDPTRVAQILTNLLNNAAHYTPEGGRIEVEANADGDTVRIAVRDNGLGLSPQQLREVFELFVQVDRNAKGGGLGIGLSLAARLAELHGGRIEARSDGLGCGAEFILILPRGRPAAPPAASS
ncbi:CHASE domain-containing protein [Ramlibacter sp. Leaf400]|uniref:CHASE domain-containing protein n=1 Tax=Ramlibacter sp. Leaf400 TaxID=1736365 RepID=UPI00138F521E|nr:CHASE domain-containing protein [Ramlibacter sp. Leaf400]